MLKPINEQYSNIEQLHEQYANGNPFPHIVIDDFLQKDIACTVATELKNVDLSDWDVDAHSEQVNKWWMNDLNKLPTYTAKALRWFNSKDCLQLLEKLTGINGLIADPMYLGGGVHITTSGGRLGIHSDFNIHPTYKIHRRLNALLFLNENWESDWHGQLQLWSTDMKYCVQKVEPSFNRLVVFNVNDTSFHGVPDTITCPNDKRRISLALYYYTLDRPENEKSDFHWALWQKPNL